MSPRDEATLLDLVRAARLVVRFKPGLDGRTFEHDAKTQSAVLHQLMVMGEAATRLSAGFRGRHSEVPWGPIAGMRDRLIHAYDVVDLYEVWVAVERDVPRLLAILGPLLPKKENG